MSANYRSCGRALTALRSKRSAIHSLQHTSRCNLYLGRRFCELSSLAEALSLYLSPWTPLLPILTACLCGSNDKCQPLFPFGLQQNQTPKSFWGPKIIPPSPFSIPSLLAPFNLMICTTLPYQLLYTLPYGSIAVLHTCTQLSIHSTTYLTHQNASFSLPTPQSFSLFHYRGILFQGKRIIYISCFQTPSASLVSHPPVLAQLSQMKRKNPHC